MFISKGKTKKTNVDFESVEVKNFDELKSVILSGFPYSLGTFQDDYRNKANFIQAESIGLDFDSDYTIEEALESFKDYKHIIATTRSHRKEKNGKVNDRFRVILFLSEPITDEDTFSATWHSLAKLWPKTDPACKDCSRYWFSSREVVRVQREGNKIDPVAPPPKKQKAEVTVTEGKKGKLSKATREFLEKGVEEGSRNHTTVKAAKDFQQNLYDVEEATEIIVNALNENGTIASDFPESEVRRTVRSAYSTEAKHEPRIKKLAFELKPIAQLYAESADDKIEWLVDGLLHVGGVSLLSADPKAGKSVIARQLCKHILTGEKFFGRKTKAGVCHYYGIEDQKGLLAQSFRRLGVPEDAQLFVHAEDALTDSNVWEDFCEIILETKPALAIIDTAFDLIDVESENNYREVKKAFRKVRKLARQSGTHILLIHHNGKPQKEFRRRGNHAILGSTAISGGVDSILVIEIEGKTRIISSSGREVDQWHRHILEWDKETRTYSLGKEWKDDDDFL